MLNLDPFQKARLKLTGWYILILFLILLISSLAAYESQFRAFSKIKQALADPTQRPKLTVILEKRISEFDSQFAARLIQLDLLLFILGSIGCYFLSGVTLSPIQKMIQNQQDFAADASHELRTPLSVIDMEIEAAKRSQKKFSRDINKAFTIIRQQSDRMRKIVDSLLFLIRPAMQSKISQQRFDLTKNIDQAINHLRHTAKQKNLLIKFIHKQNLFVSGSPDDLYRLMTILLDNAIKFSPSGKEILVEQKHIQNQVLIQVTDFGQGIAKEDLPFIFNRFYQSKFINPINKGLGLGLAIAKQIVQSQRGTIEVNSQPGKGSTFTVRLPLAS